MIKRQRVVFRAFRHHPAMPTRIGLDDGGSDDDAADDGDNGAGGGDGAAADDGVDDAVEGVGEGKKVMKKKSAAPKPKKRSDGKGKPWRFAEDTDVDFLRMLTIELAYEGVGENKKFTSYEATSRF